MAQADHITAEYVRSILDYDPLTGIFTWRERPVEHFKNRRSCAIWNTKFAGTVAGRKRHPGYIGISINYRRYYAHRLAWLYATGVWPLGAIDHANCDHSDNRIANLRPATSSQNEANKRPAKNNTSGFKGVRWAKHAGKWLARVKVNGKTVHLGYFTRIEDAAAAYESAATAAFGSFARAG